jgi:hypothetical protein
VKLKQKKDKMMKTKTLVTTLALTGALLASASVAKANAFLELTTTTGMGGNEINLSTATDPATLAASVGGWSAVTEIGASASSPLEIDLSISSASSGPGPNQDLWIIYSTDNVGGPVSGSYLLDTISGGQNVGTVKTWVYNNDLITSKVAIGALPLAGAFAGLTFAGHGSADTTGTVAGMNDFTEIIEVIPGSGHNTVSIDSNFSVPDGGSTVAMFGSLLMGLAGIRSKFGKRA